MIGFSKIIAIAGDTKNAFSK